MAGSLLIRNAEVAGHAGLVDVLARDGRIVAIGPALTAADDAPTIDAAGASVVPGLHDHHIHLMATAADAASVRLGPPEVVDRSGFERALTGADGRLPAGAWLRATAYHHSVAGDLDRDGLDALVPDRPVRVQDRTGARWTLNSAGVTAAGIDGLDAPEVERDPCGRPTGRIHRGDALLRGRLPAPDHVDLAQLGTQLAARGVTAVTDTTPYTSLSDLDRLAAAVRSGALPQRVVVTGGPELAGKPVPPGLEWGPVKLVIDDASYPSVDAIADGIATAHRHDRCAAIHCVTRASLALAVAAWDVAGARPGDRVEHGSVVPDDLATDLVRLGLTVVSQPGFVAERGDEYLAEVDADDLPFLYRCRSLLALGVPVLASTDAPYTRPDPWRAIAAAVERRTPSGQILGAAERMPVQDALALCTDGPVAVGGPADLCVLSAPLRDPTDVEVVATIRAGTVIWFPTG
ncbi:MAG: amidohydrolase family protein [Acidimicrobiia bacterium]|nr:amidohydrolase family protein [Acidimicrobiia bacterium]